MTYVSEEGDLLLRVTGILPVADFHPFVLRLAHRLQLRGWVRHEAFGASIRAIGPEDEIVQLIRGIRDDAPPSLRVRGMNPDLITADTPQVGETFVALAEQIPHGQPSPDHPTPEQRVA
jgi:hydrogenase maturation factor HypF (carbamoyltransferase family)